jgi:hypothetical protein
MRVPRRVGVAEQLPSADQQQRRNPEAQRAWGTSAGAAGRRAIGRGTVGCSRCQAATATSEAMPAATSTSAAMVNGRVAAPDTTSTSAPPATLAVSVREVVTPSV